MTCMQLVKRSEKTNFKANSRGKELGSIELVGTESSITDFGTAESDMTGRIGSKIWSETWIGLEAEDGILGEGIIGSRNMKLSGIATLGQMWGRKTKDCGEVAEEINGKTFSWKEVESPIQQLVCDIATDL